MLPLINTSRASGSVSPRSSSGFSVSWSLPEQERYHKLSAAEFSLVFSHILSSAVFSFSQREEKSVSCPLLSSWEIE